MNVTLDGRMSENAIYESVAEKRWLKDLPKEFLPFEDFQREFNLEATSTEQLHPITKRLSQTMHENVHEGLKQLLDVDEKVISGLNEFKSRIRIMLPELSDRLNSRGRIILVGSGSSGRVGVDIAAKCKLAFPKYAEQIEGVIAGGDSAMIRAKEGFEDSEADGKRAIEKFNLGPNDTVILISASGSASFNVGCGHYASDCWANVLYFYNSESVPERTQQLFARQRNPVIPLCVDIGPQAISGSTRLQGATLAEAGLGALLVSVMLLAQGDESHADSYADELIEKMTAGIGMIRGCLDKVQNIIVREHEVFSDPRSNFRELSDITDCGYITFIASEECIREVLIDATETSPTFSTNPIRREHEGQRKRAEYRAYLSGGVNNHSAWEAVLGRQINAEDMKDTEAFLLSCNSEGMNSYKERPKGSGNMLIGVAKMKDERGFPVELLKELISNKMTGGKVGLILLCRGSVSDDQKTLLSNLGADFIVLENVPFDSAGFSETILLKQILNLISNGAMLMMNKVHGNQMIDVRASNKKLIDRCIRLVKSIWSEFHSGSELNNEELYHYVTHVSAQKKLFELRGYYTPSVVKIILAMLALKKTPDDFQYVIDIIHQHQERIDWIGERLV